MRSKIVPRSIVTRPSMKHSPSPSEGSRTIASSTPWSRKVIATEGMAGSGVPKVLVLPLGKVTVRSPRRNARPRNVSIMDMASACYRQRNDFASRLLSDARVPIVIDIILPIAALAPADPGKAGDRLDPHDVLGLL